MNFIRENKKSDLEDEALIVFYKQTNDNKYIAELYNRYIHLVYGVCIKYLKDKEKSKDLVMQVFEKIFADAKKYEIKSFKFWLHTVTKNACLRELQKSSRQTSLEETDLPVENVEEENIEGLLKQEKYLKILPQIIAKLNEDQRICIELFYYKKLSYVQITQTTTYTEKQVKSYIQNAKRNLKLALEKHNEK